MKVLISAPYFQPVLSRFKKHFDERGIELIVPKVRERLEEADLLAIITDIDGVICGDDRFTPKVLAAAKKLKVISKWGTGIDSIDKKACADHGVALCNTPNAFSIPVADTVLGYALAFCRNVAKMDVEMKKGIWEKIPGFTMSESNFGIIGCGNIGTAVAKRVHSFGAKIFAADPKPIPAETKAAYGIHQVDLRTLLLECDFVSVNCDLNPTSEHLLNRETFALMKPTAFLINTARGPIVNEKDLIEALKSGKIRGAGMDVFEHEPLPSDSPLRKMDNVMMAPHNSNSSPRAWEHVHQNTMNNLFRELERKK